MAVAATDLDKPNYDPVAHLNAILGSPSSLARLPELQDHLALYSTHLDLKLCDPVQLTDEDIESCDRASSAPEELEMLLQEIERLKEQAAKAETSITDMTSDIKHLDNTKANLVKSITVLRRLQMLTNAYDQLVTLVTNRHYKEMAQTLPAVTELMTHFKSFRSISQIATLSKSIADIQSKIADQITRDFTTVIESKEAKRSEVGAQLSDACRVLDTLSGNHRDQLIQWYCNVQLREYRTIFKNNDEAGSLENISRRYGHMKRLLKRHTDELSQYFASDWPVAEELCKSFCSTTRDDIQVLLKQAGRGVDVQLLLAALQETLDFEAYLDKRFSTDKYTKSISIAFQPHLNVWIEHQDKVLTQKFQQFRAPPAPGTNEEEPTVLPSSADLFAFYKQVLNQTAKLSTGPPLLDLSNLFGKWLGIYSTQILKTMVPPKITDEDDIKVVCLVLNTADYCRMTTDQLEQRVIEQLDQEMQQYVHLGDQKDSFTEIISASLTLLVNKVEVACDYAWREMVNTNWSKLDSDGVGDQSSYVSELKRAVETESSTILNHLHKDMHARLFIDKLVDTITIAFLQRVVQLKPISEVSAEQMLLDLYVVKNSFLQLPKLRADFEVTSVFQRHVTNSLARVETVLKVILTQREPAEGLVQNYFYCVKDSSVDNFVKILQLKGIPKSDFGRYTEMFYSHLKAHDDLNAEWSVLANLRMNQTLSQPTVHSRVPSGFVASNFSNGPASIFDTKPLLSGLTKEGFEKGLERIESAGVGNFKRLFKRDTSSANNSSNGGSPVLK